jgi:hypothetical protein
LTDFLRSARHVLRTTGVPVLRRHHPARRIARAQPRKHHGRGRGSEVRDSSIAEPTSAVAILDSSSAVCVSTCICRGRGALADCERRANIADTSINQRVAHYAPDEVFEEHAGTCPPSVTVSGLCSNRRYASAGMARTVDRLADNDESTYRSCRRSRRSSRRRRLALRGRRGTRLMRLEASHVRWRSVNRM